MTKPKSIDLGKIALPVDDYASQGNAILGIRDSGKSYTATKIGEDLMDAGVPIIAFDPIGVWHNLRIPYRAGAGRGYEVVVAGGAHGDLPLTPRGVQEIVRAAMREHVSLVIDLYDMSLSKADWRRIVEVSIRTLLYENRGHGLRHVFIEEAAEFVPQQIRDEGDVYAEIEKLARMGGNAMLGYTLINQRAEQVNKAVLELCDCMILHRQKGRNSITALQKWLSIASTHDSKELIASLPGLEQGECWVWPAGSDAPTRTRVPAKKSLHPDRRAREVVHGEDRRQDVSTFVEAMRTTLVEVQKEAEQNDPKKLRAEISRLERELKAEKGQAPAAADPEALSREHQRGKGEGYALCLASLHARAGPVLTHAKALFEQVDRLDAAVRDFGSWLAERNAAGNETARPAALAAAHRAAPPDRAQTHALPDRASPARSTRVAGAESASHSGASINRPQQHLLETLAMLESIGVAQPRKTQLALWAEVSPTSGGFAGNLGVLREAGLIEYPTGGAVALTAAGREQAPAPVVPPIEQMHDSLCAKVGAGKAAILRELIAIYPRDVAKNDLAKEIGVSPTSGGYAGNLGDLRGLGIIDYPSPGRVVALPVLFLEG